MNAKVRGGLFSQRPKLCLDTRAGSCSSGDRRRPQTCAAPLPSLTLTGKLHRRSHPFDEDGMRAQPQF
jgi:hypothetical protein